ncbi:hypothetical protein D3C71_1712960 [compost metagenome]
MLAAYDFIQRHRVSRSRSWYPIYKDIGRSRGDFTCHLPALWYQPIRNFFADGAPCIGDSGRCQGTCQYHRPGQNRCSQSSGGDRTHCRDPRCNTCSNRASAKCAQRGRTSSDPHDLG